MTNSNTYAKVRRIRDLDDFAKPTTKFRLELREIAPDIDIESFLSDERFDTEQQAIAWANEQGYPVTKAWYRAEQAEGVYRDGNRNIYRMCTDSNAVSQAQIEAANSHLPKTNSNQLSSAQSTPTDISDAEDQAWQEALARMESAKAKRVGPVDLI